MPSPLASSDISSSQGSGPNQPQGTPTPLPTSMPLPAEPGPTAMPSHFSPQCPVGESYRLPTGPMGTAPPPDPRFPPPPITPGQARYTFTLPLEVSQSRFCTGTLTGRWYVDSAGVLVTGPALAGTARKQLSEAQIGELLALLNETQPQQWALGGDLPFRCQAAEICPLSQSVSAGTGSGGQVSWSDRGNLVYPAAYEQSMQSLIARLTAFSETAPPADSSLTYLASFSVVLFDEGGNPIGSRYRLMRDGRLYGYVAAETSLDEADRSVRIVSAEALSTFRQLLQRLDPATRFRAMLPDPDASMGSLAGQTLWHFEIEAPNGAIGRTIDSARLPDSEAGRALRADLQSLEDLLASWLD